MKALITGASGGIGSAVAELLRQNGYEILTLSSRFEDTYALAKECRALAAAQGIDALILCAGTAKFAPLEAMSESEILKILNVNLAANIIITRALLPNLKRNRAHIIGISSIEALRASRFSAVYSASKAGLRAFLLCLFEEARKQIRVSCINPDITKTPFYEDLSFEPADDEASFVDAGEIANFTLQILRTKSNVSEFTIRPQIVNLRKKSKFNREGGELENR